MDQHGEEDFTDAEGDMDAAAEDHGDGRAERDVQHVNQPEPAPVPANGADTTPATDEDHHDASDQSDDDHMDDADADFQPPPAQENPARRVRIHAPQQAPRAGDNRRRNRLTRRRDASQDSDDYQTGAEELYDDEPPAFARPRQQQRFDMPRMRAQLRERHAAGDVVGTARKQQKIQTIFAPAGNEVPPPLQHDPTLYFSEAAKRDDRYGMAAAKALAQMAMRDGEDHDGMQPEPELVAWNLREAGAYDLISHHQPSQVRVDRPVATKRSASNATTVVYDAPGVGGLDYQTPAPSPTMMADGGGDFTPITQQPATPRPSMPLSMAQVRMPVFKGQRWAGFKQQFEQLARYFNWSDEDKAVRLLTAIEDEGADALGVADTSAWTYDELVIHLEKRYGKHKTCAQVLNEVSALYRKPGQSLTDFHDQVVRIARTATLTPTQYQHVTYHGFTYGLRHNPQLQTFLFNHDVKRTVKSACKLAEDWETDHGESAFVQPPVDTQDAFVHAKDVTPRRDNANGGQPPQKQQQQQSWNQGGNNSNRGGGGGGRGRGGKRNNKKKNRGGKNYQAADHSDEQWQHVQQLKDGAYDEPQNRNWNNNQQYSQPPPQQQFYAQAWPQQVSGTTYYNPPAFQPAFPPPFQPRAPPPPQPPQHPQQPQQPRNNQRRNDNRPADNNQQQQQAAAGTQQD